MPKTRKLTERQKTFISEYLQYLNATQAAIRAGYSAKNADKIGPELLGKTRVAEEIKRLREDQLRQVGVETAKVLTQMALIAKADIRKIFGPNNTILPPEKWPDDVAPAIAGLKVTELFEGEGERRHLVGYIKEVKRWNPDVSLTNLAKNVGAIEGGKRIKETLDDDIGREWTPIELGQRIESYRAHLILYKEKLDNFRELLKLAAEKAGRVEELEKVDGGSTEGTA